MNVPRLFVLNLDAQALGVVFQGLLELPAKQSMTLIHAINQQLEEQQKELLTPEPPLPQVGDGNGT